MKESVKILHSILSENQNFSLDLLSDRQYMERIIQFLLVFPDKNEDFIKFLHQYSENTRFTENMVEAISLKFLDELAENFSLNSAHLANEFEWKNNKTFNDKLNYYQTLQLAVRDSERLRIKEEFDEMHNRLKFEIEDEDLEKIITLHSRKELKKKFQNWDEESDQKIIPQKIDEIETAVNFSIEKKEGKTKSFSWVKLAVAACLVFIVGFIGLKLSESHPIKNDEKIAKDNYLNKQFKDTIPLRTQPNNQSVKEDLFESKIMLAEAKSIKRKSEVLTSSTLGYAGTNHAEITIEHISLKKRIESLKEAHRQTNNNIYLSEADNLSLKIGKYMFDGKSLILYDSQLIHDEIKILKTDNQFYLFQSVENSFYQLNKSQKEQSLIKETDSKNIEILDKILFENE